MGTNYDLRGILWPDKLRDYWLACGGSEAAITEPTVAQVLYSLAIANKPQVIVESGIAQFTTGLWLAEAARVIGSRYFGFDINQGLVENAQQYIVDCGYSDHAEVHCGSAPDIILETLKDKSIDLLFLDDDHSKPHVNHEIETLFPKIASGGIFAFHDVLGAFQIWDLVKEHGGQRIVNKGYNIENQALFGGLGVIVKDE